jgi:hypothetical protein
VSSPASTASIAHRRAAACMARRQAVEQKRRGDPRRPGAKAEPHQGQAAVIAGERVRPPGKPKPGGRGRRCAGRGARG